MWSTSSGIGAQSPLTLGVHASSLQHAQPELRLRGISTPELGNAHLAAFLADYNERFAREPQSPHDVHQPVRNDEDLDLLFTWQEERKLTRNLT